MSESSVDACPAFLRNVIPANPSLDNPWITLTYAQSLDGKIAGSGRKQVRLSGEESMRMTHWMRTLHDGIMIGIGTLLNDNPRLNVRLLPPEQHPFCPCPIVLDPTLRCPPDARMLLALRDPETPHAKQPVLLASADAERDDDGAIRDRCLALEKAGARVEFVSMRDGRLNVSDLRAILQNLGIRSLMVEGGASLIQQFLAAHEGGDPGRETSDSFHLRPFIDCLIVTVAPVLIPDGFGLQEGAEPGQADFSHLLKHRHTEIMGRDAVFVLTA